jgi:four helix bundle protein
MGYGFWVMRSYKDLEVYRLAFEYSREVHVLTLKLPKYELYELGSQVRRSAQSIRANIVEGYGRRKYKPDFIKFLIHAHASLLETISHLEMLQDIYPNLDFNGLLNRYELLGGKLHNFIDYVQTNWLTHNP